MSDDRKYIKCLSLLLFMMIAESLGVSYPTTKLGNFCGDTFTLPCPSRNSYSSSGRGGVLQFFNVPRKDCTVTIVLEQGCNFGTGHAIYAHISEFNIGSADKIQIYDRTGFSGSSLGYKIKELSGGSYSHSSNPTSYGQIRTDYAEDPSLTIRFSKLGTYSSSSHQVSFDYNILKSPSTSSSYLLYEKYCSALRGYVHQDLACDRTADRVNCPNYFSNGDLVSSVDRSMCPSGSYSSSYYYMSDGAIAGAVIGSIAGFIFLLSMITICVRASRSRSVVTRTMVTNPTGPVVVGGGSSVTVTTGVGLPYPAAPGPMYTGAPPPYGNTVSYNAAYPQVQIQNPEQSPNTQVKF